MEQTSCDNCVHRSPCGGAMADEPLLYEPGAAHWAVQRGDLESLSEMPSEQLAQIFRGIGTLHLAGGSNQLRVMDLLLARQARKMPRRLSFELSILHFLISMSILAPLAHMAAPGFRA